MEPERAHQGVFRFLLFRVESEEQAGVRAGSLKRSIRALHQAGLQQCI